MFFSPWTGHLLALMLVTTVLSHQDDTFHCSRSDSRIVRNTLRKDFFPVYEEVNADPNKNCPLHEKHDVYVKQELNKIEEHQARWKCDICGKLFYSEEFLDRHFDFKHQDHLVKDSPVCLADYCDVFRCDFINNYRRDTFWEKALCKEEKMAQLKRRCEVLMYSCLPNGNLQNNTEYLIYDSTQANICSLLTCKDYWRPPYDEIPAWRIVLYAIFTPFFIVGAIVYYYSAYEYYYGDLFQDIGSEMEEHTPRYVKSWQRSEVRHRYQTSSEHMY